MYKRPIKLTTQAWYVLKTRRVKKDTNLIATQYTLFIGDGSRWKLKAEDVDIQIVHWIFISGGS